MRIVPTGRNHGSLPSRILDGIDASHNILDEAVPLKLDDYNTTTTTTKPSEYYSTFVDLVLAGNGNCVAYGRGGFGCFASLLSYNASCSIKHVKSFFPVICQGEPPFVKED
jgi:hypothetical protein